MVAEVEEDSISDGAVLTQSNLAVAWDSNFFNSLIQSAAMFS